MRNTLLILILFLPFIVLAQKKDTTHDKSGDSFFPEGYASASLVSELWVISHHLPAGYSTLSYRGPGLILGGGFSSKNEMHHLLGYGIGLDYLHYNMSRSLSEVEQARTSYSFAEITPAIYLYLKSISMFNIYVCGNISLVAPLQLNEKSYLQSGAKACVCYKAYEVNVGFSYSLTKAAPSKDIASNGWHEQMFVFGVACYPYRIPKIRTLYSRKLSR